MQSSLTLFELNNLIRGILEGAADEDYWVTGEFAEARVGYGGHFYAELVQKDEAGTALVAKARVNCWARQYNMLRLRFLKETGQEIRAGLKVMALVRVTFHELYGYSLQLLDLNSNYTLGDMARRRQEILRQLEEDGVLHDNQQLALPRLTKRIAVISSASAAGYGDFCDQLQQNEYGLDFRVQLFPAVMQGANVERSILEALYAIADQEEQWDAVVIIRGGGATSDLSDFDSYPLASAIAQFPLPVIVGIGHERDETVLDYVAHTSQKTPTAVAAFLIDHQLAELAFVQRLQETIMTAAQHCLQSENHRLQYLVRTLPLAFARVRESQEHRMQRLADCFSVAVRIQLERGQHRLQLLQQRVAALDPAILLQRGYSMTTVNGRLLTDATQVCPGETLVTQLAHGKVASVAIDLL